MPTVEFEIAANADDGDTDRFVSDSEWPPVTTDGDQVTDTNEAQQFAGHDTLGGINTRTISHLRWDTSSIPDGATITDAKLRVDVVTKNDGSGNTVLRAEWRAFTGTLDMSDYDNNSGNDALNDLDLSAITVENGHEIQLIGFASGVNKTGMSGLRMQARRPSDVQPTGVDQGIIFAAKNDVGHTPPTLVVTYTESGGGAAPAMQYPIRS